MDRLFRIVHPVGSLLAHTAWRAMCHRAHPRCGDGFHPRITAVRPALALTTADRFRWLLDMDRDEEGMRVLADLHGDGDLENEKALDEFREIKDGVLADVRPAPASVHYTERDTATSGGPQLREDVEQVSIKGLDRHVGPSFCPTRALSRPPPSC